MPRKTGLITGDAAFYVIYSNASFAERLFDDVDYAGLGKVVNPVRFVGLIPRGTGL